MLCGNPMEEGASQSDSGQCKGPGVEMGARDPQEVSGE